MSCQTRYYETFTKRHDLRSPRNEPARREIMTAFGLDPAGSYAENARHTGTPRLADVLAQV